jgi:V8-like Glu-specific endopeptidase
MSNLTGAQWKQLSNALAEAFPTYNFLQVFLQQEMGLALAEISAPQALPFVIFEVLQFTEAFNRTAELVEAARRNRPDNTEFFAVAQQLGTAPVTESLEKMLTTENIVFDVANFRRRVASTEARVCRIDIKGKAQGTGFLIGPSAVMTNYHVVEKVIQGSGGYKPADVTLLFDYKLLDDGTTLNPGTTHHVAADWLIDSSPYSKVDMEAEPKSTTPKPDELDYAILRVDGKPAEDALGKVTLPGFDAVRGHIPLPALDENQDFSANKVLYIMQHPKGNPLKLTVNTFRSFNQDGTRLTYLNDTENGSSGSPCLDANWQLAALHHSGDPAFKPSYNEGIPMHKIVGLLDQRGVLAAITQ